MIIILILISSLTCETIFEADEFSWTSPNSLENRRGWVAAGLILINIKRNRESWAGLRENFVFLIDSLLSHTPNTNIHFIVITDEWTRNGILFNFNKNINLHERSLLSDAASLLSSSVSQFLTMNIIAKEDYHARKRRKNLKLGRYRASYVDITSLVSGEEELLSVFKANTDSDILNSPGNMNYFSTIFYIAPSTTKSSPCSLFLTLTSSTSCSSFPSVTCGARVSASPPNSRPTVWRHSEARH